MSPPRATNYDSAFAGEWDNYVRYRPVYPDELFDKHVFAFHDAHCPDRSLVIDYGCGPGVLAPWLLRHFQSVFAIDMGEGQISVARSRFANEKRARFEVHSANDKLEAVPDGAASMAIAGTAMPWFDHDLWFAEVARVLRPGGTLAFFGYHSSMIISNAEANHLLQTFIADAFARMPTDKHFENVWRIDAGALHLHLPEQYFHNERRIIFDQGERNGAYFIHDKLVDHDFVPTPAPVEREPFILRKDDMTVEELEGLFRSAGAWWDTFGSSWEPTGAGIAKLTGGRFNVVWQLNMTLASRR